MHRWRSAIASLTLAAAVVPLVSARSAATECEPAGRTTVVVELAPPAAVDLAGVKIRLDYPEAQVQIPGRVDDADVKARVTGWPAGVMGQPNDEDDALIVALVSTAAIPKGPIFTVAFDACRGAKPAVAAGFTCAVEQASDGPGKLVSGATCRVTIRNDKEGVTS